MGKESHTIYKKDLCVLYIITEAILGHKGVYFIYLCILENSIIKHKYKNMIRLKKKYHYQVSIQSQTLFQIVGYSDGQSRHELIQVRMWRDEH